MNIILKSVGVNKVKVIRIVREITGLGLKEAKEIVDGVEDGIEYTITNIPEEKVSEFIEQLMAAGAVAEITDREASVDSVISITEGDDNESSNSTSESEDKIGDFMEKIFEFHENLFNKHKIPAIVLLIVEALIVIILLIKYWEAICVCILVAAFVAPFIFRKAYKDEDRDNVKELFAEIMASLVKWGKWALIIVVVVVSINFISSRFNSSAVVRNSYFLSYSDEITIGEAFENVFTDCKWSSYKYNDNKYVRFTGDFTTDEGETSTYQFNFLVMGDSCTIDSIYVNGLDMSGMETVLLVGIYNRNGVSW